MPSRTCVSVGVGEGHEHREIKIDRVREEDTLVLKGLQPRAAPDAGQKSCVIQGRYIGRIDVTKHVLHGVCEIDVDGGKTDDNAPDQVRAAATGVLAREGSLAAYTRAGKIILRDALGQDK